MKIAVAANVLEAEETDSDGENELEEQPALWSPDPVAALLVARVDMARALQALNQLEPRWGALIARAAVKAQGASRKGVHVPDPGDLSAAAPRAVELPAPLDRMVAAAAQEAAKGARGRSNTWPAQLLKLLADGVVVFEPSFVPPVDLDDLHPCLEPEPQWASQASSPLPAQVAECGVSSDCHDGAAAASPCCGPGPFRFIELFAGIGGFRVGLEALGGRCVFASEMHPTAQAVYRDNLPQDVSADILVGDIRSVASEDVPEHEILTAGFPCQPFSALGEQRGLQESRGRLFMHICRLLRARRPPLALLENVPGLLETDEGRALEAVLGELRASGYRVAHRLYNSSTLLPQKRKRIIVAIRADLEATCESFRFPWLPELGRHVREALEDPVPPEELEGLLLPEKRWARLRASAPFGSDAGFRADVFGSLDAAASPLVSSYGKGGSIGQFARYTQLLSMCDGDNDRPRRFSCRECARLQGFPEEFSYASCAGPKSWYRLIGNAVSPPLVCALAGAALCALRHPGRGCRAPGTGAALALALRSGCASTLPALLAREVGGPPPAMAMLPLSELLLSTNSCTSSCSCNAAAAEVTHEALVSQAPQEAAAARAPARASQVTHEALVAQESAAATRAQGSVF